MKKGSWPVCETQASIQYQSSLPPRFTRKSMSSSSHFRSSCVSFSVSRWNCWVFASRVFLWLGPPRRSNPVVNDSLEYFMLSTTKGRRFASLHHCTACSICSNLKAGAALALLPGVPEQVTDSWPVVLSSPSEPEAKVLLLLLLLPPSAIVHSSPSPRAAATRSATLLRMLAPHVWKAPGTAKAFLIEGTSSQVLSATASTKCKSLLVTSVSTGSARANGSGTRSSCLVSLCVGPSNQTLRPRDGLAE
mmetsp:Transcript_1640/g.7176  ORF Transcript_1640/g.7176 Transcript_1640/m.7176 type:complete len:248 (-) Transcript_1640:205-948(-)